MSALNFKDSYKKDNENIKPRKEVLINLSNDIKNRSVSKKKFKYKLAFSIAVVLIFSYLIFAKEKIKYDDKFSDNITEDYSQVVEEKNEENEISDEEINTYKKGIYVPKQQLPEIDPNIQASRVATLVYKGRVYTIAGTEISLEEGKALMDKNIGTTWSMMKETRDDGTVTGYIDLESLRDFASSGEGEEVYTVKDYDENFRLITHTKNEYGEFISLWECLNDFNLLDGSDVLGKMNIKGNLESITWETFNNWNYGNINEKEVTIDDTVNNFIDAMYKGTPYSLENEELRKSLFDKESNYSSGEEYFEANEERQKFIFLKMKDGTKVEIRLFKEGYIYYSGLNFAFKIDEESFNNMWNKLTI
jgi:hypothetical protein